MIDLRESMLAEFTGSIFVMTLYDMADEIDLVEMRSLVSSTPAAPSFKHTTPEYVKFERPPVIEPLDTIRLKSGEEFSGTIQFYDYGVASVLLRRPFSGSWMELNEIAARWIAGTEIEQFSGELVRQRLSRFRPALRKPYDNWLYEDYYIFHLSAMPAIDGEELLNQCGRRIAQLVNGEVPALSDHEIHETLQARISYYPNDLTVIGWNAAFIYDTDAGADSTVRLLEYANSQLLQFRHYDDVLTRELADAYRVLEKRTRPMSGWRMRSAATRLRTLSLEVIQLAERTTNALKFVGDMFSARLYKLGAKEIGVSEYQALVHEKLRTADELYDFMIEQFHQARGFLLELAVVIILVIELGFLFRGR
jgi:hypothetical protein